MKIFFLVLPLFLALLLALNYKDDHRNISHSNVFFNSLNIPADSQNVRSSDSAVIIKYNQETVRYEPKPGKLLGIWVDEFTEENLMRLKTFFGYSGIFCRNGDQFTIAEGIGYLPENTILSISYNPGFTQHYIDNINQYNAGYYYIDESVEHKCTGDNRRIYQDWELREIVKSIKAIRPESFFVSSGYKRCSHFDSLVSIADKIMYSAYSNWIESILPCPYSNVDWGPSLEMAYIKISNDQRSSWTDMKSRYGSKFSMSWINSYKDINEFDDLFNHAKTLGLYGIWVYTLDGKSKEQLINISESAWRNGFLRKWIQDVKIIYKCKPINENDCNSKSFLENYYLDRITPVSGTLREIFPD